MSEFCEVEPINAHIGSGTSGVYRITLGNPTTSTVAYSLKTEDSSYFLSSSFTANYPPSTTGASASGLGPINWSGTLPAHSSIDILYTVNMAALGTNTHQVGTLVVTTTTDNADQCIEFSTIVQGDFKKLKFCPTLPFVPEAHLSTQFFGLDEGKTVHEFFDCLDLIENKCITLCSLLMTPTSGGGGGSGAVHGYYSPNHPLVVGANLITHNLALTTPFITTVETRDPVTGGIVNVRVVPSTRSANTLELFVSVAESVDIIITRVF